MLVMLGSRWIRTAAAVAAMLTATFPSASLAQDAQPEAAADPGEAIWQAAIAAMVRGPNTVQLKDQAQLALPAGYGFVPPQEGAAVMDLLGNQTDERFIGLIFPESDANWFVTIDYEPSGYIKDDDAKEWDADELLQSLKDGTEAANEHRREMGVPEIQVTRWVEKPAYDAQTHRLVWSAEARDKSGQDADPVVNYNTYVLGREGYVSLNLITNSSSHRDGQARSARVAGRRELQRRQALQRLQLVHRQGRGLRPRGAGRRHRRQEARPARGRRRVRREVRQGDSSSARWPRAARS